MKNALLYVGAALTVLFSLNSCNKEIQNPEEGNVVKQGSPFAIIAKPVETRTTMDELSVQWAAGDGINVFHAVAGATEGYVSDGQFTIAEEDLTENVFRGTVSETLVAGTNYDWYMFYPYTSQMVTPGEKTKGYVTVGSGATGSQTQSGNSNMAHLAGTNVPLVGKITNVSSTTMPSVSVNQICAFLEINVTNNSGSDLTVSQVSFTGTEPIVGTYFINFAGDNVEFTGSGSSYVSATAKLTVNDGTAITDAGSAKFYIAIKPFSAPSNGKLKIAVNGYEKEITLSSAVAFNAGKIKKINFDYDDAPYIFTSEQFERATSVLPGDRIIITNATSGTVKVMKHFESGNNYKAVDAEVSSGIITSTAEMAVLTVGGQTGNLTFYDDSRKTYLNATDETGSNYLKESSDVDSYAKWTVSFSSNAAVIKNTGKTSRNIVRYNSSSSLFSCYTSGQNEVYIFKKQKELSSISVTDAAPLVFFVGDAFSFTGTVTASYADGSSEDVTSSAHFTYDLSTSGTKTVTVSYTRGTVTKTATYEITVNEKPVIRMIRFNSDTDWETADKTISNGEGTFSIAYAIDNPVGSESVASVSIPNEADWIIADDPATSSSEVSQAFYVEANSSTGGPRSVTITLMYSNAQDVVFTVTQEAGDDYVEPSGPVTLYSENFGSASDNTDISAFTGWSWTGDNHPTGSWKVSKNSLTGISVSTGKYEGASGQSNLFSGATGASSVISFGNISSYSDVTLSFGWANNAGGGKERTMSVEVSGDNGTSWSAITFTTSSNATTNDGFHLFTYNVPANLLNGFAVRFTNTAGNVSRIDDVTLIGNK